MDKVLRSTYVQVHNPFPVFTVPCKKGTQTPKRTLPFIDILPALKDADSCSVQTEA